MKKNYEELEHKKREKRLITFLGITVLMLLAIVLLYFGITKWTAQKVDTTEGIKAVKKLEQGDIKDLEKKVQTLEEKDQVQASAQGETKVPDDRPLNERFAGSVILGDSITKSFSEYEILDESIVIADIGAMLSGVDEELTKAEGLNPKNLFLCYGENDVEATRGDAMVFKQQYKAVIDRLKTNLPETKIYVNSILPVKQKEIDREPSYAHLPEYNVALQELCTEEGVTFIDNTTLTKDEFYEPDGIHQTIDYYPIWAKRMAEVAGI